MSVSILDRMGRRFGRRVSVRADGRLSAKGLRERCAELHDKAQGIIDRADRTGRDLTVEEQAEFDGYMAEHNRVRADLGRAEWLEAEDTRAAEAEINRRLGARGVMRSGGGELVDIAGRWTTAPPMATTGVDGQPVYCLGPGQRFADLPGNDQFGDVPHAFGQCLVAAVTGRWNRLPHELKNAMQEGSSSGGGILVPAEIARQIIDQARARSVIIRAGGWTQPMSSDRCTIARVHTDPTFETHAENVAITESDIVFDGVSLTARTIGTLCRASRELIEDASNMAQIIEGVIVRALAAELDRQMPCRQWVRRR